MLTPSFTPARIRLWGSTVTGNERHWLRTLEVLVRQLKKARQQYISAQNKE